VADYHCDQCGADAEYDEKFSGCGDRRCCTPIWDLVCGCSPQDMCACNSAENHRSSLSAGLATINASVPK